MNRRGKSGFLKWFGRLICVVAAIVLIVIIKNLFSKPRGTVSGAYRTNSVLYRRRK